MSLKKIFIFKNKWVNNIAKPIMNAFKVLTFISSLLVIVGVIYQIGFYISPEEKAIINVYYHFIRYIYLIYIILAIFIDRLLLKTKYKYSFWILSVALLLTFIPSVMHTPVQGSVIAVVYQFLDGNGFNIILLSLFSILILSNGIIRILGKQTNPSFVLAISFLLIIIIGAFLLEMPHCTKDPSLPWLDAFFISTSAVCVTGLTSVDVCSTFTPTGMTIILLLIQIGGLGVMTFTSFFAMFFMGNTSLYSQLVVKDFISSDSLGSSLRKTLFSVLVFTLLIELAGACLIWFSVRGTLEMSFEEEIMFSVFHSVSAFCNAGFSTLPDNLCNPLLIYGHSGFYLVISFLVIFGGIGFPILVNLKNSIKYQLKNFYNKVFNLPKQQYLRHLYSLNTKIVVRMTSLLLISGTIIFAVLEWNGALAGFSFFDKLVQSFFNATIPRTAGFVSIDVTTFKVQTLMIIIILMWIGGASQSTAGGIKVNTLAVSLLNLGSVFRNSKTSKLFGRTILPESIRRANAVILISLILLFSAIFIMTFTDPHLSLMQITFECFSALGTVGSSMNATMLLSNPGKVVTILLMFVGRVGVITLIMGIVKPRNDVYQYPSESIIIN